MIDDRQFLHEQLYRGDDFRKLSEKVVVIAGLGAVGSWVAVSLARVGVRNFRLIDKDRVEIHNVSTQLYTPKNVGQHKARAIQERLYRISKARCELQSVELTSKNAGSLLKACDLVICSFDNQGSRETVKTTCLKNNIPCLFSAMDGKTFYMETIWAENYIPPNDPSEQQIDPCNYPLATNLCILTASITSEISIRFLLENLKGTCRLSFGGIINQTK